MKKIFWRIFVYFGVVLIVFTLVIGLLFTRFNRSNLVGVYKDELGSLAASVAARTRAAVNDKDKDGFADFLKAVEDFGDMQDTDIWVVTNPKAAHPMDEDFANVDISTVSLPEDTSRILDAAYKGKKKSYSDYDKIYQKNMLHLAVPVRDNGGDVMGAVLVSGPMDMQEDTIIQYEKFMLVCVVMGLALAILLAFFFSRQLVRPIIKIKEAALILAAGKYDYKTGVERRDELGALARSMDTLSDKLVEAEAYRESVEQNRRDFFSNVSHELRTPITVVKGYADTLAEGYVEDAAKQKEYIGRIRNECGGMERLVSDLLILSRMQNPDYALDMEVLNVIAVAQDAIRSIRILMREKNLSGQVTYDDACSFIRGDYDRIRQLFTILLENAVKYSYENTEIRLHISREDQKVVALVQDHGVVIPEDEWENVFEKFYRASSHGKRDGSGLGLVVAKNIVERHQGEISVQSTEKDGTSFLIKFPETSENIS